jgi:hypothetical protein
MKRSDFDPEVSDRLVSTLASLLWEDRSRRYLAGRGWLAVIFGDGVFGEINMEILGVDASPAASGRLLGRRVRDQPREALATAIISIATNDTHGIRSANPDEILNRGKP